MSTYNVEWDKAEDRTYETGCDHGVLYDYSAEAGYHDAEAWNGLTQVSDNPEGGETNSLYADNMKYLNLVSAENLKLSIQAYTYPDGFAKHNGEASPEGLPGVKIRQQSRLPFGFCYRTKLGNSVEGEDYGYRLHLVYGCTAAPSSKDHGTTNENPDAAQMSWEINTIPVPVTGFKPTACVEIDSVDFKTPETKKNLDALLTILYGTGETKGIMPLPDDVFNILKTGSLAGEVVEDEAGGTV